MLFLRGGDEENVVEHGRQTELTAFLAYNADKKEREGADFDLTLLPKHVDMPETYTFSNKAWHPRKKGMCIG